MSVRKHLLILSVLLILHKNIAQETNEAVQYIDHPNKNEYISQQPGTDKHKYGYELKDNKHFHHTTTEEDGVRLGCYGYVLEGKKYSTQYVADAKGYRPVYTYDKIRVYTKAGEEREASFIGNFNEDEKKSSNIRYFFPEGCKGGAELRPEENPMTPPPIFSKFTPPTPKVTPPKPTPIVPTPPNITPPKPTPGPTPKGTPPPVQPTPSKPVIPINPYQPPTLPTPAPPPPPSEKYLPPTPTVASTYLPPVASTYLPPAQATSPIPGKYITKVVAPPTSAPKFQPPIVVQPVTQPRVTAAPKPDPQTQSPTISKPPLSNCEIQGNCASKPITIKTPADTCSNQCCSNDEAKITIPIKLKSANGKSGCASYAKLVVPADSVSADKLKLILSNPNELVQDILRSLS